MKFYKYQIINDKLLDNVENIEINDYIAENRNIELSVFSIEDKDANEFVSAQDSNLSITEITQDEFDSIKVNTWGWKRAQEVFNEVKENKLNEIGEKFKEAFTHCIIPIEGIGNIDGGESYLLRLQSFYITLENVPEDQTIDFRLADNTFAKVTKAQVKQIIDTIITTGVGFQQKKWQLEDTVKLANSITDIFGVEVEF